MIAKLIIPAISVVKTHLALAGIDVSNLIHIESKGLDIEANIDNFQRGENTLGLLYDRGRLSKESSPRPIEFPMTDLNGSHYIRKAMVGTLPINLVVVSNSLDDLDNVELMHRLELINRSFEMTVPLEGTPEESLLFTLSYHETHKANEANTVSESKAGFHSYAFTIKLQGYFLSPYISGVDIVSAVDFSFILSDLPEKDEPNDGNSIRTFIR